jgi:hypothetical protein
MVLSAAWNALIAGFIANFIEKGLVPDFILRAGIRYLLSIRAAAVSWGLVEATAMHPGLWQRLASVHTTALPLGEAHLGAAMPGEAEVCAGA